MPVQRACIACACSLLILQGRRRRLPNPGLQIDNNSGPRRGDRSSELNRADQTWTVGLVELVDSRSLLPLLSSFSLRLCGLGRCAFTCQPSKPAPPPLLHASLSCHYRLLISTTSTRCIATQARAAGLAGCSTSALLVSWNALRLSSLLNINLMPRSVRSLSYYYYHHYS